MGTVTTKPIVEVLELETTEEASARPSMVVSNPATVTGDGVSVSGGKMRDIVGVKHKTVNNYFGKNKNYKSIRYPKKKCWNTLIRRQRREESWFYPFPWDTNIRLAPEEYFVEVDLEFMDRTGQFVEGKVACLKDLFSPFVEGADTPDHILIRGDAGYGKSTMCIKIAFDWANNIETFDEFPPEESLVILFKLRDLPPLSDFHNELCGFVHNNYTGEQASMSETQKACWSYGNKLLLILDGYDELYPEHQQQIRNFLSSQNKSEQSFFKYASVILTSRPETDNDLLYLFDKHCRITGLSEERRHFFVNSYFKRYPGSAEAVLHALNSYEDTYTKCMSPLLILMICYIVKLQDLKDNLSGNQLTLQCINLMAKRWNERQSLGLEQNEIEMKIFELGKYMYNCLSSYTLFIRAADLRVTLQDHYEFAVQFGILRNPPSASSDQCEIFEPIHKHFMDVLAKYYLQKVWLTCLPEQRLRFTNDFVDSLSTTVLFIQGSDSETKIYISAKDLKYRANKILYGWKMNAESSDIVLTFEKIPSIIIDLSLKITANNFLQNDIIFFISYISKAFSMACHLEKWAGFLGCFRQYLYRIQFCRSIDMHGKPFISTTDYICSKLNDVESQRFYDDPLNYTPWSVLKGKIHFIEVELGEALTQPSACLFVCKYILGFNLEHIASAKNAKKFFSRLYRYLECDHDRFYIKCVLKSPVGSMFGKRQVDLITFQCNYKHEHLLGREIEVGGQNLSAPVFYWDNLQSIVFYFLT